MEGNIIINLFTPYRIKDIELKNRIVMSPMCMYSSDDSGMANDWHYHHLLSRAIGGTGLIIQEATAVQPEGRITHADLGIWHDDHIPALEKIVHAVQRYGAKIGIQLAHAGRKATVGGTIYAPSPMPYDNSYKTPHEMTKKDILETIQAFKMGAERAKTAGYDLIEIHAAHGYLINSFLSPLTNKRYDEYGGSYWNRFRFLEQILEEVKSVWEGPLFVRISAEDYHQAGYHPADYVDYTLRMKETGVDLVDCSSGAVAPARIDTYPGYQVKYAEIIKEGAHIPTGAVGLITSFDHADEIIRNERSDLVFLGRILLRDPYWALKAAHYFNVDVDSPVQYERAFSTGRTSS